MADPILTPLTAATLLTGVLGGMSKNNKLVDAQNTVDKLGRYGNAAATRLNGMNAQNSLTDLVKLTRVQPLTILDSDVLHYEGLTDVLQSTLSIFTGYYLQALAIVGSVQATKVMNTLGSLNPTANSGILDSARHGSTRFDQDGFSVETYHDRMTSETEGSWKMAKEAYKYSLPMHKKQFGFEAVVNDLGKDTLATVRDASNLSVGKMINVTMSDTDKGESKATMPISVRLATNVMSSKLVEAMLTQDSAETSLVERYHAWRGGQIEFIRDLILCQDLIDNRKKLLLKDKSGVYSSVVAQASNHAANGLMGKNPSLAAASNIVVISDTTQAAIEAKLSARLSDVRTRNKMFQSGYMMLLVVIEKRFDRVTFYHRGIANPTSVSLRDIKISNKGSGPDLMDIVKAFGLGTAPSF